jgi:23S rRNA (uracil1939-C5)-methyltransferase
MRRDRNDRTGRGRGEGDRGGGPGRPGRGPGFRDGEGGGRKPGRPRSGQRPGAAGRGEGHRPVRARRDEPVVPRRERVRVAEPPAPAAPPPGARLIEIEELEIRVEKLVAGGEGMARYENIPLFIPRSAPGDRLRVRIVERRPDYGRAEIVEILEPGPDRRPDPFPELAGTGLADLQHLHDRVQPRLKAEAVRETLERLGRLELPGDLELVTGDPWGYRLRTQVHTELDPVAGGVRVGYHARGTNDVVPVSRCPLLVPELEALFQELPRHLGPGSPRRLDLAAGDGGAVTVSPVVPGLPHGEIATQVGELTYAYDARAFFQGHRGLLPLLVDRAVGPWIGETALDLYAGVGLFSLPLSRLYKRVVAVEGDPIASRYARMNVRRNRVENVEVAAKAVESWLWELPEVDRIVVDPPRAGLSYEVRGALLLRPAKRLTYVSCHPAALARDLRVFENLYRIESVTLFDLFPQTGHMETVVQLVLRSARGPAGA